MADWVPPGAWLAPGYAEWAPPAALRPGVTCLWASLVPGGAARPAAPVLPDGCSDLIWEQGAGAFVAGPDTSAWSVQARPGAVFVGVRFAPGAGGQVLGLPLSELRDQRVPLDDLTGAGLVKSVAGGGLSPALPPAGAAARLLDITGHLIADASPDPAVHAAVSLLRDPAARAGDVAQRVGLSERQLRRRCHAAAGYGPKALQRILRFNRFVRMADAAAEPLDLAGTAVRLGYADQPHLTRDCASLAGLTPAALAQARRPAVA